MKFTKMNGLGNDYIFINADEEIITDPSYAAIKLSDRHKGIGGDGIVLIGKAKKADFSMRIFNSDGSEGKMCGNALRCLGKFVYEKGLTEKKELTVDTLSGIKRVKIRAIDGMVQCARAWIGKGTKGHENGIFERQILSLGKPYNCFCVSVGNPHCVIFVDRYDEDIMKIGRDISENKEFFPDRTNVEFVLKDLSDNILTVRVYERGSGETLACGTGASAAFFTANVLGLVGDRAVVRLPGGDLECSFDADKEIVIDGRVEKNFEGEI